MARVHWHDLKLTGLAIRERMDVESEQYEWNKLNLDLKVQGHNVRKIRTAFYASIALFFLYALYGGRNLKSPIAAVEYVVSLLAIIILVWITWRGALSSARKLAQDVMPHIEDGVIEDPDHPRVLFGPWIPPSTKGPFHSLQKLMRKWKK